MKTGRKYQVFMAPSAHRRYKKFNPPLKEKVKEEAETLAEEPYINDELKGPLKGIRSHHFHFHNTQFRIAYRIIESDRQIEIVLVKSRESFYQTLRRLKKGA